jgi:hypothetical protein
LLINVGTLSRFPPDNVGKPEGLKIPRIDANVELAWHRLQPSMTVAMQIDRASAHVAPGPERVVAQNKQPPPDRYFCNGYR